VCCVHVFFANSMGYVSAKNWQNWMTPDYVITNIIRVTFSETQCICIYTFVNFPLKIYLAILGIPKIGLPSCPTQAARRQHRSSLIECKTDKRIVRPGDCHGGGSRRRGWSGGQWVDRSPMIRLTVIHWTT